MHVRSQRWANWAGRSLPRLSSRITARADRFRCCYGADSRQRCRALPLRQRAVPRAASRTHMQRAHLADARRALYASAAATGAAERDGYGEVSEVFAAEKTLVMLPP